MYIIIVIATVLSRVCVCVCVCVCERVSEWVLSHFSHVWLCVALWTVACQAPLSVGFSRQEYWSGWPCPPLGHLPNPGIKPASLMSPALAGRLPLAPPGKRFKRIDLANGILAHFFCKPLLNLLQYCLYFWCWEGLGAGGEGDDRWDGWIASLTQWTWVWVSSGSWWWTGRPGMLQSIGSQRVRQDWAAELNCLFYVWVFLAAEASGILAPQPGIEPTPSALEGKVLTTGPLGSPLAHICIFSLSLSLFFPGTQCLEDKAPS